jgi:hypothetical protein
MAREASESVESNTRHENKIQRSLVKTFECHKRT